MANILGLEMLMFFYKLHLHIYVVKTISFPEVHKKLDLYFIGNDMEHHCEPWRLLRHRHPASTCFIAVHIPLESSIPAREVAC